jgi:hypothetical protein
MLGIQRLNENRMLGGSAYSIDESATDRYRSDDSLGTGQ